MTACSLILPWTHPKKIIKSIANTFLISFLIPTVGIKMFVFYLLLAKIFSVFDLKSSENAFLALTDQ